MRTTHVFHTHSGIIFQHGSSAVVYMLFRITVVHSTQYSKSRYCSNMADPLQRVLLLETIVIHTIMLCGSDSKSYYFFSMADPLQCVLLLLLLSDAHSQHLCFKLKSCYVLNREAPL